MPFASTVEKTCGGTVRYRTVLYRTVRHGTALKYGTLFGTLLACAVGVIILDQILDIPARARNHAQMQRTVRVRYCILKYGTVHNMYLEMFYTKSRVEIKGIL